ncbi:hypothetical protein [Stutzerimonas nitrititolerans]|uniref:hypothetical protein n=1 Tax=Stutzerimonas nitrititolerans TaxID=2482751 RepID=UPI0028AD32A5|nr:hypothetical protein [Stutzerimonas nitrititolerans]
MLTASDADRLSERMLSTYCRECGVATPDDVRKACEMMISKAARAIEKYNGTGSAIEVLQRTTRHVARVAATEVPHA